MIFAGILAGGIGSRMGSTELPKQFLLLGDKPIIIHTLEKFLLNIEIDKIYIGVPKDWILYLNDLILKFIGKNEKIEILIGGVDRNGTIMNIIENIHNEYGENEEDVIITHDAVRPFVNSRVINENIEKVKKVGACNTVIPSFDTIVISKNKEIISEIPDRRYMYQGQTPQSFKISLLKKLYNELSLEEKEILTDACKIFVVKNYPVYLVAGEIENLKITTQGDYKIAKAMIGVYDAK